ncbi:MAG: SPOR domain-containing protein [Acidobacteriia bacterium]|jgi:cell division septation protein DedD|nr:SPOR domain-containing protein [Terriglobia bacterium]
MAEATRRSGRDLVLEGRHVLGLFFTVVILCGVFFTLGYVMGRSQHAPSVSADALPSAAPAEVAPAAKSAEESKPAESPAPTEWNFYKAAEPAAEERLSSPTRPRATAPARSVLKPPLFAQGAIVLQVAALTKESDALALAQALQEKRFPAFVLTPSGDKYYRVQVGPYGDVQSAERARQALAKEGFKTMVRR